MRIQTLMAALALAFTTAYPALAQPTAQAPLHGGSAASPVRPVLQTRDAEAPGQPQRAGQAQTVRGEGVAPLPARSPGTAPEAGSERFDFPPTWTGRTEAIADAQRESRAALAEARARCKRETTGTSLSRCMDAAQADSARLLARAKQRPLSPTPLSQRPVQLLQPGQ